MNPKRFAQTAAALAAAQLLAAGASAALITEIDAHLDDGTSTSFSITAGIGEGAFSFFHTSTDVNEVHVVDLGGTLHHAPYNNAGTFFSMHAVQGAQASFAAFDASPYEKLLVSIDVAVGSFFDTYDLVEDLFKVNYAWDGGVSTNLGTFEGNGNSSYNFFGFGTPPFGVGMNVSGATNGVTEITHPDLTNATDDDYDTALFPSMTNFVTVEFELLVTGNMIAFDLFADLEDEHNILAWDNFKVQGLEKPFVPGPDPLTPVPEPSTYGLLGALALVGLIARRRFTR